MARCLENGAPMGAPYSASRIADLVAAIGGKVSAEVTREANREVSSGAVYGDFARMMRDGGAQQAVDQSYCVPTKEKPC
jgi:hypothetical protein